MSDLFISYSTADRSKVERLAQALEAEGWSVWWDRNILAGRRFNQEISRELAAARCVIVVWSEHSVDSDWVLSEADKGLGRDVLTPVRFDEAAIPMPFDRVQAVSLAGWSGDTSHPEFRKLVASIANTLHEERSADSEAPAPRLWRRLSRAQSTALLVAAGIILTTIGVTGWRLVGPNRGMVRIGAGEFRMGTPPQEEGTPENETPRHTVYLDEFFIDRYEVTVADFRRHMEMKDETFAWNDQQGDDQDPVIGVTFYEAEGYCTAQRKSLPTEVQWEKAARGPDAREYPWGDDSPTASRANFFLPEDGYPNLAPVGSFRAGSSPYGVHDMAGNVAEWVVDWYVKDTYLERWRRRLVSNNPPLPEEPQLASEKYKVVRGGSWRSRPTELRAALRKWELPSARLETVGFRCVRNTP